MSTLGRKKARAGARARDREDDRLSDAVEEVREERADARDARAEVRALGAAVERLEVFLVSRLADIEVRVARASLGAEAIRHVACPYCRQILSLDVSARTLNVECGCGGWSLDLGRPARPVPKL